MNEPNPLKMGLYIDNSCKHDKILGLDIVHYITLYDNILSS